jgi:hypothetical protein
MKIDGDPFPVNMIGTIGLSSLINKYQRKRYREDRKHQEFQYDPHRECPFFKFCWKQVMKLPSVNDCPGCSARSRNLSKEETRHSNQASHQIIQHRPKIVPGKHGVLYMKG